MTRWTEEQLSDHLRRKTSAPKVKEAKPSKYRNRKTTVDGIEFDSAKEARRYQELKLQQEAGHISGLRWQVPISIVINGYHICNYIADFQYWNGGQVVTEDVKSAATRKLPVFVLKNKLIKAVHNIDIQEV